MGDDPPKYSSALPVPDPSKLTTDAVNAATEQWRRDLVALQHVLEARLDGMDTATRLISDRIQALPMAEREFLMGQISLVGAETQRVLDVTLEKFVAIAGTFASNALALTAALAAQKEAASETNKSNALAINKSEQATKETIISNQVQTTGLFAALTAALADLKDRVVRLETGGIVNAASKSDHRLDVSTIVATVSLFVAIAVALLLAFKK